MTEIAKKALLSEVWNDPRCPLSRDATWQSLLAFGRLIEENNRLRQRVLELEDKLGNARVRYMLDIDVLAGAKIVDKSAVEALVEGPIVCIWANATDLEHVGERRKIEK